LEGPNFWSGLNVQSLSDSNWTDQAAVVIQPALIEDNPRLLLRAISAGIPVICTEQCGVSGLPGVTLVEFGNTKVLKQVLLKVISEKATARRTQAGV
jgi:hypothetical protein